jgi:hypothetical protein
MLYNNIKTDQSTFTKVQQKNDMAIHNRLYHPMSFNGMSIDFGT